MTPHRTHDRTHMSQHTALPHIDYSSILAPQLPSLKSSNPPFLCCSWVRENEWYVREFVNWAPPGGPHISGSNLIWNQSEYWPYEEKNNISWRAALSYFGNAEETEETEETGNKEEYLSPKKEAIWWVSFGCGKEFQDIGKSWNFFKLRYSKK